MAAKKEKTKNVFGAGDGKAVTPPKGAFDFGQNKGPKGGGKRKPFQF